MTQGEIFLLTPCRGGLHSPQPEAARAEGRGRAGWEPKVAWRRISQRRGRTALGGARMPRLPGGARARAHDDGDGDGQAEPWPSRQGSCGWRHRLLPIHTLDCESAVPAPDRTRPRWRTWTGLSKGCCGRTDGGYLHSGGDRGRRPRAAEGGPRSCAHPLAHGRVVHGSGRPPIRRQASPAPSRDPRSTQ